MPILRLSRIVYVTSPAGIGDGETLGLILGLTLGLTEGDTLGLLLGLTLGLAEGDTLGLLLGLILGLTLGLAESAILFSSFDHLIHPPPFTAFQGLLNVQMVGINC